MPDFSSTFLEEATGGTWSGSEPDDLSGICFDARQLQPGECFVALSGGARDGHEFVRQAREKGARAAITERRLDIDIPQLIVSDSLVAMGAIGRSVRHAFIPPVIGITGSCGKTSTKEILRLLLGTDRTHATAGNWNNRIGVPMTLFELDETKQDFAIVEAGINQPGEMDLLGKMIAADVTILTNIGLAHLELLGSRDGIAFEKARLAEFAVKGSPLILPADALRYSAIKLMLDRCVVLAGETEIVPDGVRRVVRFSSELTGDVSRKFSLGEKEYTVRSPSEGIAANAALALIAAEELGIAPEESAERLLLWRPESYRGRVVAAGDSFFYIDCYNANPSSMADALSAFVHAAPKEMARCYVLGAMNELGFAAEEMHESIGRMLNLQAQDLVFFVGPDSLSESYRKGAFEAGASETQLISAENISLIESAVAEFQGALFLKGSRSYQLEKLLPESII
ncbi:MAG: UDP-N-acetylmuramoyl-tripeptide--D-alanyl-D-alanine ligase [Verrucomicrobiota bacterium]